MKQAYLKNMPENKPWYFGNRLWMLLRYEAKLNSAFTVRRDRLSAGIPFRTLSSAKHSNFLSLGARKVDLSHDQLNSVLPHSRPKDFHAKTVTKMLKDRGCNERNFSSRPPLSPQTGSGCGEKPRDDPQYGELRPAGGYRIGYWRWLNPFGKKYENVELILRCRLRHYLGWRQVQLAPLNFCTRMEP